MILVTGSAGFIGFHVVQQLRAAGHPVVGIDDLNDYYDPQLKRDRLRAAGVEPRPEGPVTSPTGDYTFYTTALEDGERLRTLFRTHAIDYVCHLAAQAGVRYSLKNPQAYVSSNVAGFVNVLECCREFGVGRFVYASSSSVYGLNESVPFTETDPVERPASLYAATKRSNELLAHVYGHLYGLPTIGLRFFTVYGPWGRPDMAYSLFSDAMLNDRPIRVFNHGAMARDFTYVTDIAAGVCQVLLNEPAQTDDGQKLPVNRLYNIGAGKPVKLLDFIELIEAELGITARKEFTDMQPGDVEQTYADTTALERDYGYRPMTTLREGITSFVRWYLAYYGHSTAPHPAPRRPHTLKGANAGAKDSGSGGGESDLIQRHGEIIINQRESSHPDE